MWLYWESWLVTLVAEHQGLLLGGKEKAGCPLLRPYSFCPLTDFFSFQFRHLDHRPLLRVSIQLPPSCTWIPVVSFSFTPSPSSSKRTFSFPIQEKCISEVARIGSIIIFHLSKLWKRNSLCCVCSQTAERTLQTQFEDLSKAKLHQLTTRRNSPL